MSEYLAERRYSRAAPAEVVGQMERMRRPKGCPERLFKKLAEIYAEGSAAPTTASDG